MPKYSLVYFDIRGLAEPIRLLFKDQGVEFEDVPIKGNWDEVKPTMRFGQVPCLKVDGEEMVQSCAILRYLAKQHGVYGGNDAKAQYWIDMWNDYVEDIKKKYVMMIYMNYDAGKEPYIKSVPDLFAPLEKQLKDNQFIAGNEISFADYNLFNLLNCHEILQAGTLAKFQSINAYYTRMAGRPKLAEYLQSEKFKTRPLNGNGKQ